MFDFHLRAKRTREEGQSLLELAILVPLLLILALGVIEVGQLAYFSIAISNAARAGVAYGAQSHITAADNAGMVQAAENDASGISDLSVTASHFCQCADSGTSDTGCEASGCPGSHPILYVQVLTQAQVNTLFMPAGKGYTVNGSATMRVTQ